MPRLQISKKCYLRQRKEMVLKIMKVSQHNDTEPCEIMPLVLTLPGLPRSVPPQSPIQNEKTRCLTYICMPLYPAPQYDNNKTHFFFLGTTFDFPFLSFSAFWTCANKKQSNTYNVTLLLIILTIP